MSSKKLSLPQTPLPKAAASGTQATSLVEARSDRLARLKLAIDDGTYKISGEKIADKLIDLLKKGPQEP